HAHYLQPQLVIDHGTGDAHPGEALLLDELRRQRGEGSGERLRRAGGEQGAQVLALLGRGPRAREHQNSPFGPADASTTPGAAWMLSLPSSPAGRWASCAAA